MNQMPAEDSASKAESRADMPLDTPSSGDRTPCSEHEPGVSCNLCSRKPAGMPGGLGSLLNPDRPDVGLASEKAIEEFNRRNKDRYLSLAKVLEARGKCTSMDIYHLTIEATEEGNVEEKAKGPCTRSQTALRKKSAKARRKRRLPRTVRIEALVTVSRNRRKKIKADFVYEV